MSARDATYDKLAGRWPAREHEGALPREPGDQTWSLLREGYAFISNRCGRHATDAFEARILLQKTICIRGADAARLFYDTQRFQRDGAAPRRLIATLFGEGGVQGLDGEAHLHRKRMFMSLMNPESLERLTASFRRQWYRALDFWERKSQVVLFDAVEEVLCRAVCEWAHVPVHESEVGTRTNQMSAMIEASGAVGFAHWRGRLARTRAESWMGRLIEQARSGEIVVPVGSALQVVSEHRDVRGELLPVKTAAVELLNVLRPVVAVGRYITYAASRLDEHPQWRKRLVDADDELVRAFVQEVRRHCPFFPFVAAKTKQFFEWKGYQFPRGVRVLLDIYGTNRDPRVWDEPERFDPERFLGRPESAYDFIPQGGGDFYANHRCAGEWITIALMEAAVKMLVRDMHYRVPPQDQSVSLSQIPAKPKSGVVIEDVHALRVS